MVSDSVLQCLVSRIFLGLRIHSPSITKFSEGRIIHTVETGNLGTIFLLFLYKVLSTLIPP